MSYRNLGEFVAALNAKFAGNGKDYKHVFMVAPRGRKYQKVVVQSGIPDANGSLGDAQRSVYCFVDESTGAIYKAEGWAKPAKGIRATLATLDIANVDPYGSWLYAGR